METPDRQRPFDRLPENRGLYDFQQEHDACGIGLVANLNNVRSHAIVEQGLTVLKHLMHRGAAGSDPNTGDGAGLLLSLPDEFFRREVKGLPEYGKYGVAMIFGGIGDEAKIEQVANGENLQIIAWRNVPIHPETIGETARESCPAIRQLFVTGSFGDQNALERKLYVVRRMLEKAIPDMYICSFSSRSVVYKGLLLATQLEHFYSDLGDADFKSPLALVHQRYSTNTFPTWSLAHPFRYLAHNGEINTLRGNLNHMKEREPFLSSPLFGKDLAKLLPLIDEHQSDSASLDNMFELLNASGRSLVHSMLMLMPQAWGKNYHLGRDVRGFFDYHSALMEPWDGPAAVAFSDGVNAGAILDRNGLRPARYTLTGDGTFVLASETGVLDLDEASIIKKGRLRPGEIIFCDLEHHRLVNDAELKNQVARRQPYRRWAEENKLVVHGVFDSISPADPPQDLLNQQRIFGYSREDIELLIRPMAATGHEPIGSMGNDAALAVLSDKPQLLFNYFKQLFAQVTNPPIDPIREELVMSLTTYIGNLGNILDETPQHAKLIKLPRPILTDEEMCCLQQIDEGGFRAQTIKMEFVPGSGKDLEEALDKIALASVVAARNGVKILILSDRCIAGGFAPVPSLLATAVVNRALLNAGLRPEVGVLLETGEAREVMHFALLLGYGATAVNPYLALETVSSLADSGALNLDRVTAAGNYIRSIGKGLLKVMSKMGISTLRSYRSGQIFEAVGLSPELVERYFKGTASRVGGIGLDGMASEINARLAAAERRSADPENHLLEVGGQYKFRRDGETHLWTPDSLAAFRQAVHECDREKYDRYAKLINDQSKHLCTLRGLFEFKPTSPIPIEEVESADSIVKRFVTGAISLGSISPEAHETIAVAMNKLGGMSNCGEGGEDENRYTPGPDGENRTSAIKQVASGRFGVTIDYLRHAKEIQIKMAQGAKPGEGGQLPGHKVNDFVARIRHSVPQVSLISPPPHHDIYSIEDLAQLVYDLHNANPDARISVKLVSEIGVGTIAAGVVKAHANMVLVSGHDGGTGASPLTSVKHAGLPWELGVAETQQTLVLNQLRDKIRLQVDGQIKTGRDVIIGALLGAEEFGFATTILVCLGCVMMRKCHDNSCPVGVATQDPELRKRFTGRPEYIENFLRFVAEETRGYLARLGLRSLDEAIGRSDLLEMNKAIDFYKSKNLDFSRILTPAPAGARRFNPEHAERSLDNYDRKHLLPQLHGSIENGAKSALTLKISNVDRTVGTELSGEVVAHHGSSGLPKDTITVDFHGCAGQSFGAFLAPGITFRLHGEANDFVGKGLSGGKIVIVPKDQAAFDPSQNVIAGNVIGYGGTSGLIFIRGQAGERFCVRNSGIIAVVESVGDHGCEYMTGGIVVVLGKVGVNFAAGMTAGIAYVYDEDNNFDLLCNVGTVDLESIASGSHDEAELMACVQAHYRETGSDKAKFIMDHWENERARFVKVFPVDYRKALGKMSEADANAVDRTLQII